MVQHVHPFFSCWRRNRSYILLAFCWTSGFVVGFLFYKYNLHTLSSLMRRISLAPVSIVGLLLTFLLPFLFSAFAVIFHTPIWIFPISVCKAFLFAIVSIGIIDCIGSAGWLYRILLLTGDILSMPALYLYWLRSLLDAHSIHVKFVLFWAIVAFLLGCVNNCFLLHVLAELGN